MKLGRFFTGKYYKEDFENEFYTLIQLARDDPDIKKRILFYLRMDDFNRKSFLNTWINELKFRKAPKALINGLSCLVDDEVAKKTLEILGEQGIDHSSWDMGS